MMARKILCAGARDLALETSKHIKPFIVPRDDDA